MENEQKKEKKLIINIFLNNIMSDDMVIDDEHYRYTDSEYDMISKLVWTQNLDELREYLERGGNPLLEKDSKYSDGTSRMDDGESLLYISMFLHPNIEVCELLLHYIDMRHIDPNTQLNNGTLLELLQFRYERDPRNEMNNRLLEMLINAVDRYEQYRLYLAEQRLRMMKLYSRPQRGVFPINNELLYNISKYI